jgi:hypothetical protein
MEKPILKLCALILFQDLMFFTVSLMAIVFHTVNCGYGGKNLPKKLGFSRQVSEWKKKPTVFPKTKCGQCGKLLNPHSLHFSVF